MCRAFERSRFERVKVSLAMREQRVPSRLVVRKDTAPAHSAAASLCSSTGLTHIHPKSHGYLTRLQTFCI